MVQRQLVGAVVFLALIGVLVVAHDDDDHMGEYSQVTMSSTVQLVHIATKFRLHSHPIQYGTGSGQQSVTALESAASHENLFQIHSAYMDPVVVSGTPVRCGSVVRLRHIGTKKWLHSHLHSSPVSRNQEVTCFGEGSNGDTGDNWRVICDTENWTRGATVQLLHVDTSMHLSTRRANMFTQSNCPNCPINGQLEVYGQTGSNDQSKWTTGEGVFFRPAT